ncbi:hypothetical protein [Algoriphagus resistens]|uniref:hypothetical protein n=1 Tax=Algoriphagus resistens TaxID=1750590 RepID=UPI000716C25D|nr:hypothetical protein [Algoriphagus resistens]
MKYFGFLFILPIILFTLVSNSIIAQVSSKSKHRQISGIYPHLAFYNDEGECGTGAVVPWGDRLWVITYAPHMPFGSSDKLYEITPDLDEIVRKESIGGTPANRMIHDESNQLFIGPYAIADDGNVRTIPYEIMPGRHTGNARHLSDPENKIYYGTMEEGFYEVDVHSLEVKQLYVDGNVVRKQGNAAQFSPLLVGAHGKGLYAGQGVLAYSNNGEDVPEALKQFDIEAGALAEWDGKDWKIVRRNQFVEVTGPGGIHGNPNSETDPIWATGWDHRSVLLASRDHGKWSFYRMPKASHSYDGAHGWNTEWPRIRDIGTEDTPEYLMTMHGMFWDFPQGFNSKNTAGIRPRSAYLKVIGDYARWNDQLVFGCDDSAQKEFLNKRNVKGGIEGPGQSNSNLWFTSIDRPDQLGPNTAEGALYISEQIVKHNPSDPFLFAGWDQRMAWVKNEGESEASFDFEVDKLGNGNWTALKSITVSPGQSAEVAFGENEVGEWVRVKTDRNIKATVHFTYTDQSRYYSSADALFNGLATLKELDYSGGLLYGLGENRRALGILSGTFVDGTFQENGYYELDGQMNLVKKDDPETADFIKDKFAIAKGVVAVDASSVLVIDDSGRRWRLPLGEKAFDPLTVNGTMRIAREVATERDLFNAHGTFYELPAENADGFAKIRPVASHQFKVHDFASYRGLLVLSGLQKGAKDGEHIIISEDGKASVWVGAIDDLWKLGKPTGTGGPWKDTRVKANVPSDPYLIGFYDQKSLSLSHDSDQEITFILEVEPIGHGPWMTYKEIKVPANETIHFEFPETFQSRWIRFKTTSACSATAWLTYK